MIRDTKSFVNAERHAVATLSSAISSLAIASFVNDDPAAFRALIDEVASGRPNAVRAMKAMSDDLETLESIVRTLSSVRATIASEASSPERQPH